MQLAARRSPRRTPESGYDDTIRFDSLINMNDTLSTQLSPKVRVTCELRAKPVFEKAHELNTDAPSLKLDPSVAIPRHVSAVDIHRMLRGHHTEVVPESISASANCDAGICASTSGMLGRYNDDGGGQALAQWPKEKHFEFKPRRILDLGCTVGHNVVPLAQAFPDAEVIATPRRNQESA